jgi:hypothetical protein
MSRPSNLVQGTLDLTLSEAITLVVQLTET